MGYLTPLQLRWRPHAVLRNVRGLRCPKSDPLDLRHLHDLHPSPSLFPRRGALPYEVWRTVGQVLQHSPLEADPRHLVNGSASQIGTTEARGNECGRWDQSGAFR